MKLATLENGSRDGQLLVVSNDLQRYLPAPIPTLQAALDDWLTARSLLTDFAVGTNFQQEGEVFDASACVAPLPRAFQWLDGSAYVNHVSLVRQARGAEMPERFWTDPLMYQGCSDSFLGPCSDIPIGDESWGIDFEAEIAVVTGDAPMGVNAQDAGQYILLVMLCNDVSLRKLIPSELSKGLGFIHSKPPSAFSPVAVTIDELSDAWHNDKLHLPMLSFVNGEPFGKPNAGIDMTFDFGELIAHAAKTRPLVAGTIVGSGTISNRQNGGPGQPIAAGGVGYSCIAEQRMVETIQHGKPSTQFLHFGDSVRIEMQNSDGESIFGAIDQTVVRYSY